MKRELTTCCNHGTLCSTNAMLSSTRFNSLYCSSARRTSVTTWTYATILFVLVKHIGAGRVDD